MTEAKVGDFMCIHSITDEYPRMIASDRLQNMVGTIQQVKRIHRNYIGTWHYSPTKDGGWISEKDCYIIPFEDMPWLVRP